MAIGRRIVHIVVVAAVHTVVVAGPIDLVAVGKAVVASAVHRAAVWEVVHIGLVAVLDRETEGAATGDREKTFGQVVVEVRACYTLTVLEDKVMMCRMELDLKVGSKGNEVVVVVEYQVAKA